MIINAVDSIITNFWLNYLKNNKRFKISKKYIKYVLYFKTHLIEHLKRVERETANF